MMESMTAASGGQSSGNLVRSGKRGGAVARVWWWCVASLRRGILLKQAGGLGRGGTRRRPCRFGREHRGGVGRVVSGRFRSEPAAGAALVGCCGCRRWREGAGEHGNVRHGALPEKTRRRVLRLQEGGGIFPENPLPRILLFNFCPFLFCLKLSLFSWGT